MGETPFDGATHFEIMMKHLNEVALPISARGVAAPPALDQVLRRALTKNPAERYQAAADFSADLDRLLADAGPAGETPAPIRKEPSTTRPFTTLPFGGDQLAAALEPGQDRPRRRSPWLVATIVPAAALALLLGLRRGPAPAPAAAPAWPAPQLVDGFAAQVDVKFEAPELVRVLAPRPADAARVARAYVAARARFAAWAAAQHGASVEIRPLNLVLATPEILCAAVAAYTPSAAPADCVAKPPRFLHVPKGATLYVLDDERLEAVNLPEGAAQHVCANTPALLEKRCMRTLLPPYWDEVERAP